MADNPWLDRRVLNYAHQGGAREAPSSTVFAMRRALEAGATALEMDVHATADGHLVVCHDSTVDRTTNGKGPIAALTLEQVTALDNAYWFVPGDIARPGLPDDAYPLRGRAADDPELRIPTLRQVLEAFPDTLLNLDIKQTAPAVEPYEEAVATLLAEFGRTDDVIVASFHDAATAAFTRVAPGVGTSPGTAGVGAFFSAFRSGGQPPEAPSVVALQVPPKFGPTVIVSPEFVEFAHRHGVAVHVWTIDDPDDMEVLVDQGVDAVMTDRPSALTPVLAARGAGYGPARS
ncbi:MAG TPA: glycerophosphodiester phosphodiesterase [Acidimicrobiales bacterium]|nr:glycerophosphodiester phosphodiesterase [Acidimicrobiales bacterium]